MQISISIVIESSIVNGRGPLANGIVTENNIEIVTEDNIIVITE